MNNTEDAAPLYTEMQNILKEYAAQKQRTLDKEVAFTRDKAIGVFAKKVCPDYCDDTQQIYLLASLVLKTAVLKVDSISSTCLSVKWEIPFETQEILQEVQKVEFIYNNRFNEIIFTKDFKEVYTSFEEVVKYENAVREAERYRARVEAE